MESTNFSWSNYRYMDCYRAGLSAYAEECRQPDNEMGLFGAAWGNLKLSLLPVEDLIAFPTVSLLRSMGYLISPIPAPEQPNPQDDTEFLCYAEKRALHLWEAADKAVIQEGLDDGLSDEYEIYSVLGEWSIAAFYENAYDENGKEKNFYIPTFLEASKPLPNDRTISIMSTLDRFWDLSKGDRKSLLEALYTQKPLVHWHSKTPLEGTVKEIHRDIRALASHLHQGNRGFLDTTNAYFQKRASYLKTEAARAAPASVRPSAPPASLVFNTLTQDVAILRDFISNLKNPSLKTRIRTAIGQDRSSVRAVNCPGELDTTTLEKDPLHTLARLLVLIKSENNMNRLGYPQCFPWGEQLRSGETIRQAVFRIETLSSIDREKLIEAVLNPQKIANLSAQNEKRFFEVSEIAEKCLSVQRFREMYKAYRTSLFAPR